MSDPNQYQSIKFWAEDDRPREKLLLKGKSVLSDAELVAILIGSGTRDLSAVDLAKQILNGVGNNLNELGKQNVSDLCKFKGIGEAKAVSIITALELGLRRRVAGALVRNKISSSKDVYEIMLPHIGDLMHEEFWVLFLSNSNHVLSKSQVSKGGITGTLADVRTIYRNAITNNCTSIVACHNHPSGQLKPSEADKRLTQKIREAGVLLNVKLLDHVIVSEKGFYSFADNSIL